MTETSLICFRNTGYSSADRIVNQATEAGFFDRVKVFSEKDVSPLIKRHRIHFLLRKNLGFGTFLWKPYIIQQYLESMKEGDFLVYADIGVHVHKAREAKFQSYIKTILEEGTALGAFEVGPAYPSHRFVTSTAVMEYLPSFYGDGYPSVYAGLLMFKKTALSQEICSDWLYLCEKYLPRYFSPFYRSRNEVIDFEGQDTDSGFLPLILKKRGGVSLFPGSDINLYNRNGMQLKHSTSQEDYLSVNWSNLDGAAFSYRRDR